MRIIAELVPSSSRDRVLERARALAQYVSHVDVPEAPGGVPTAHALAVGCVAREVGLEPLVHIRLVDLNRTAFRSLLGAAALLGINSVVLLQGDPPREGTAVRDLPTEEAVREAQKAGLRAGALLSLRLDYRRRLQMGADFYLALHLRDPAQLEGLRGEIYPYVLVRTERNRALLERLGQPSFAPQEVPDLVAGLKGRAAGVVISSPGDFKAQLEVLRRL